MIRVRSISLLEVAELIAATFEEYPADPPEDLRSARLFRSVLLARLKQRFGDDWVRAWDHLVSRQDRGAT